MNIPQNRLWAAPTNSRTLETMQRYRNVYACSDHILIIHEDRPKGFEEVDEELAPYLSLDDWAWLWNESERIRREQEQNYHDELTEAREAFLKRFEAALEAARREEEENAQTQERSAGA